MSTLYRYENRSFFLSHSLDAQPQVSAFRMHTHTKVEIYLFLRGKGVFHAEGTAYPLSPGDVLVMKPMEAHYIELEPGVPYERAVLNMPVDAFSAIDPEGLLTRAILDRDPGRHNHYKAFEFSAGSSEPYWQTMLSPSGENYVNLLAGLTGLLREINNIFSRRGDEPLPEADTLESRIVRYINSSISQNLTLETVCNHFFISKSQLCRLFKKATATTVWQYITVKRLALAQQLLAQGEAPTKLYSRCGFNDYSTFYRAYVKHFGRAPGAPSNSL